MVEQGLTAALAAAFALALPAAVAAAPRPPLDGGHLTLTDDRGEPLGGPVQVCFVLELETDCVDVAPPERAVEVRPGRLIRVEGPDYGPVTMERAALEAGADGERTLAVPRKAHLVVSGTAEASVEAALFPTADPDFDRPAYSYGLSASQGAAEVAIPAGGYVLALEARGAAPDLHRLEAPPGATRHVRYQGRGGGSLIVRAVAGPDLKAVGGAQVRAQQPPPARRPTRAPPGSRAESSPQEPPAPVHTAETAADGLALMNGVEEPLLDVTVAHPDFVEASLPGVSVASGALEHREVTLKVGGILEARIEVGGEPGKDWRCRVLDRAGRSPSQAGSEKSAEIASAQAGADGLCRLERLPEGRFWLRVAAPEEGEGSDEREVHLVDAETTRVDLHLSPIQVEGRVTRAGEPVAGCTLSAYRTSETGSTLLVEPVTQASTDDDGHYEVTLWDTGTFAFELQDPTGRFAASKNAEVTAAGEEIDFVLAPGDLEGEVVDQDGKPLEGAQVMAKVRDEHGMSGQTGVSGADGSFRFPLEARGGTAELSAILEGYRPSPKVEVPLSEGVPPPPVVLTLTRGEFLRGLLLAASGAPIAGASILAFPIGPAAFGPGRQALAGHAGSKADGSFEILPAEGPRTRLFAMGPACPLTSADVPSASEEPVVVTCPASAGTLVLRFKDASGQPLAEQFAILRTGDVVLPLSVLTSHLFGLGLPAISDASGTLTVPGLAPGRYDVYDRAETSEAAVAQGRAEGYAGSVDVPPGGVAELEITAPEAP